MSKTIMVFDNLVQQHSSGVIGLKQKVRAICRTEDLLALKEATLRARQAGKEFRKMFQLR
jgi:hypothetical protein